MPNRTYRLRFRGWASRPDASVSMMEGIPMPIIQQQLGHASLATTNKYLSHIAPKDVIATVGNREWNP
ncbi:MAG: hypothetical protein M3112_11880 [Actinomycetia bacterium]|nr:hypothetical protein [Actinomycetes bacterium]